jgi:hypothetical protein
VTNAKYTRQSGNQLSGFMPKKMLYQLRNLFRRSILLLSFGRGHRPGAQESRNF